MVGDDIESDIGGALGAGLDGVLVRTGKYREAAVLASGFEPTATVDSIADVPALLVSSSPPPEWVTRTGWRTTPGAVASRYASGHHIRVDLRQHSCGRRGGCRGVAAARRRGCGFAPRGRPAPSWRARTCVVVGAPTHMHGLPTSLSRKMAAQASEEEGGPLDPGATAGPGIRSWLSEQSGDGRSAAAFDTRADGRPALTGSAARGIAKRLRKRGFEWSSSPKASWSRTPRARSRTANSSAPASGGASSPRKLRTAVQETAE